MAGLTSDGFEKKRLPEIIESMEERARSTYGKSINVDADSVIGQMIGIISPEISAVWDVAEAVHSSFDPAQAEGAELEDRAELTGMTRLPATKSTLNAVVGLDNATYPAGKTFPKGRILSVNSTGELFETIEDTYVSNASAVGIGLQVNTVADSTAYEIECTDLVSATPFTISYTSGVGATEDEIIAGLLAAFLAETEVDFNTPYTVYTWGVILAITTSAGEVFSIDSVTANLDHVVTVGSVKTEAVNTGEVKCEPEELTAIETPVEGFTNATNIEPAIVGTFLESDNELRLRRSLLLAIAGTATLSAIVAGVGILEGVTEVFGIENNTLTDPDANGLPAKSFEIVVDGGDNYQIAGAIFATMPAGIESYGSSSIYLPDQNGELKLIKFTRPTYQYIHFEVDYTLYDEEEFSAAGEDAIKAAVIAYAEANHPIGKDVIPQRFMGDIYRNVSGIENLEIRVDATASPGDSPTCTTAIEEMDIRDLAQFDIDRITVTDVT